MSNETGTGVPSQITLQCLSGAAAPRSVLEGWRGLIHFPDDCRHEFWDLLGMAVMDPGDPSYQARLESFCDSHKLEPTAVLRALQACELLLGGATTLNLDPTRFREDLVALSDGQATVPEELLSRYQAAQPHLRNRLIEATLTDHGKLLTGLDWRVDNVMTSDRGTQLDTTVIFLTLRYQDGDNSERVTLQLTPGALQQLKTFTDRFSK